MFFKAWKDIGNASIFFSLEVIDHGIDLSLSLF